MPLQLIIVGAGGHGKVVLDAALAAQQPISYLVDDAPACCELLGLRVVLASDVDWQATRQFEFLVAVGDNRIRAMLFQRMLTKGGTPTTIIHPSAIVSKHACIGRGTVICAGVIVNAGAVIGENCILNTACSIDHDCRIGDHVHICPGVHLAGNVTVGEGTIIGIGSSVIPGKKVGDWSILGAGSVVVRDIPDQVIAFGVPARVVRSLVAAEVTRLK